MAIFTVPPPPNFVNLQRFAVVAGLGHLIMEVPGTPDSLSATDTQKYVEKGLVAYEAFFSGEGDPYELAVSAARSSDVLSLRVR